MDLLNKKTIIAIGLFVMGLIGSFYLSVQQFFATASEGQSIFQTRLNVLYENYLIIIATLVCLIVGYLLIKKEFNK